MINEKVVIEENPAAVILNKFITGEEDSNYEIFLLEYVNQSKYFQEKSMHEKYVSFGGFVKMIQIIITKCQYINEFNAKNVLKNRV